MTVEKEFESFTQQGNISITKEDVSIYLRKMPNWKVPGPDGLHGFWLKKYTSFHQVMVKDVREGNAVGNYRPIACLNFLWKLLTGIINDKLKDH